MDTTLFALWNDETLTVAEIAGRMKIPAGRVYSLARRYGLPRRKAVHRAFSMDDAVTPEDEAASADSLALAPAVQRRIKELGYGFHRWTA